MYNSTIVVSEAGNKRRVLLEGLEAELVNFQASDMGNAQAVNLIAGGVVKYTEENGWFFWNGAFWENSIESVKRLVSDVLTRRHELAEMVNESGTHNLKSDRANITGAMWMLQSTVLTDMAWFDRLDDKLPTPSGVIDLRTGELLPHDKEYGFTFTTTVNYNPEADTKPFENLIRENIESGSNEAVQAFQRWLGYTLTGDTREEKILYLWGPGGSGKGTVANTAMSILPKPLQQVRSFSTFTAKRSDDTNHFDMARLERARMLQAQESDRRVELNAAMVKSMTGDVLNAAYKGKDSFEFTPKFKVTLTTNWSPNADVDDSAIWNRLIVVNFPHERRETADENMTLKTYFQQKEVKEGVLLFMVQGAVMWYQQGLNIPDAWKEAKHRQRDELDMVKQWLEENTEQASYDVHTGASEVISNYNDWCKLNSVSPKQAKAFSYAMKQKGYEAGRNTKQRFYRSLTLTTKYIHERGQILELIDEEE